jgi:hypothetical protein
VAVFAPGDGAVFVEGARQRAVCGCGDPGGPGLASCNGPVPNGSFIDTDKVGRHTFTVTGVDKGGRTTTRTVHYRVLSRGTLKTTGRVRAFRRNGKVFIDTGVVARCPGLGPDCVGFAHPHAANRAPRLKRGGVESAAGRPVVRVAGGKSVRLVFEVTSKRRVAALERGRTIRLWVHARLSRGTSRYVDMRRLADVKLR